jgi:short-subunit dehydrogenase
MIKIEFELMHVVYGLAALPCIWLTIYLLTNFYMILMGPVNLKKKYDAKWALVTGAATGIGRSLAESMALQGLNVVLVSLPDKHLEKAAKELRQNFPELEFRVVPAVFDHKTDYMPAIIEATKDIDVQIVWNNAGYIVTGFFDHTTVDTQLANLECNATACVKVTHHFLQKLLQKEMKGTFIFTSSLSGYIPNPFGVIYGATKSFVSQFAGSLAVEVRNRGIDVVAVHPSPVASNFFDKAHKLESLDLFKLAAVQPAAIPGKMLTTVGRSHLADMGAIACFGRIIVACFPYDFLCGLFSFFAPLLPDYNNNDKNRGVVQAPPGRPPAPPAAAASTSAEKKEARSRSRSTSRTPSKGGKSKSPARRR